MSDTVSRAEFERVRHLAETALAFAAILIRNTEVYIVDEEVSPLHETLLDPTQPNPLTQQHIRELERFLEGAYPAPPGQED